ncbi:hypothetical protein [Aeromonas phage AS-yj]|uniref:Uncharacterized protein n=1 Tax=Aeromonas phage AS-yj TaxID=2026115 RepID=A0A291LE71_9CAUD|nr:hypothetical protein [Aeromonas phage AS-yj]
MFTAHNLYTFTFTVFFVEDTTPKDSTHVISDVYVHIKHLILNLRDDKLT